LGARHTGSTPPAVAPGAPLGMTTMRVPHSQQRFSKQQSNNQRTSRKRENLIGRGNLAGDQVGLERDPSRTAGVGTQLHTKRGKPSLVRLTRGVKIVWKMEKEIRRGPRDMQQIPVTTSWSFFFPLGSCEHGREVSCNFCGAGLAGRLDSVDSESGIGCT
jgi:hypothetical protein